VKLTAEGSKVAIHRYALPSIKREGWAIITLSTDGMFSAVSDYGDYAHLWTHHGMKDFREFFTRPEDDWDYIVNKLSHGRKVYDGRETVLAIKRDILSSRRDGSLDRDEAREEWDLLEEHRSEIESHQIGFHEWCKETNLDTYEMSCWSYEGDLVAFGKKVLPRLAEAIRAELEAEVPEPRAVAP